jgi:hypothetical protein
VTINAKNKQGAPVGRVKAGDIVEIQYVGGKWHDGWGVHAASSPDEEGGLRCALIGRDNIILAKLPSGTKDNPFKYTVDESYYGDFFLIMEDSIKSHHDNTGQVRYSVRIISGGRK